MRHHRYKVRCWMCGFETRRVRRGKKPLLWFMDPVINSCRYGDCPNCSGTPFFRDVPLLPPGIAKKVLRRALRDERRGMNKTSEYDL